jgi:hypothetical protein
MLSTPTHEDVQAHPFAPVPLTHRRAGGSRQGRKRYEKAEVLRRPEWLALGRKWSVQRVVSQPPDGAGTKWCLHLWPPNGAWLQVVMQRQKQAFLPSDSVSTGLGSLSTFTASDDFCATHQEEEIAIFITYYVIYSCLRPSVLRRRLHRFQIV